jgi:hypothetical protein
LFALVSSANLDIFLENIRFAGSFQDFFYFCHKIIDIMSKRTLDIIEYTIALVNEFAKRFGLSEADSFRYIDRYNGMKLIEQCYGIMHTLSFAESVDGMASYCRRQGGTI